MNIDELKEKFFYPNISAMEENFSKNTAFLKDYPFLLTKKFIAPQDNPYIFLPHSQNAAYVFNKNTQELTKKEIFSTTETKYFFKDLDKPLMVKDEYNAYNLEFLADNVRKSEDFGGDNHIYLCYENSDEFSLLLYYADLTKLFANNQFVVLIGSEKDLYPINFKSMYGIEYDSSPKDYEIDDIKRIVVCWRALHHAGSVFFNDILDFHPNLINMPRPADSSFFTLYTKYFKGKDTVEALDFLESLSDEDERKKSLINLIEAYKQVFPKGNEDLSQVNTSIFLIKLRKTMKNKQHPTVREWLIGIYLAFDECYGHVKNSRIVPAILLFKWDNAYFLGGMGRETANFYENLTTSFKYFKVIMSVRNPIVQMGSVLRLRNKSGVFPTTHPFWEMTQWGVCPYDYYFPVESPLYPVARVVRFEDLKLNPEATLTVMCEYLNIPYSETLLKATYCGKLRVKDGDNMGGDVQSGYDTKPVFRANSEYLSYFDKYRLEMMMDKFMELYGYKRKYYDGQKFAPQMKRALMEFPFLFEQNFQMIFPPKEYKKIREQAMTTYVDFALAVSNVPFTLNYPNGKSETFSPLPWLYPDKKLLKTEIYS